MAKRKERTSWECSACGAVTNGWFGRCSSCGGWNTIVERVDSEAPVGRIVLTRDSGSRGAVAVADAHDDGPRRSTGLSEIDRVLGGGLAAGSVVLLGGAPGIGKSTLLLQAGAGIARGGGTVLYASGEESVGQVSARARRLAADAPGLLLQAETRIEAILSTARGVADLAAVVVDSVQTIWSDEQEGLPGNVTQVRAVASQIIGFAKSTTVPAVMVGHVTKDGQLAGPRVLEHMVDTVLSFEGDDDRVTRLLRATKNRFGSTQELGVFEMTSDGLREIENPSQAFLSDRTGDVVGACVTAAVEGTRPLLIEIEALLAESFGGGPRRTCVGIEPSRLAMLLAVLDRHGGIFVLDRDVFVNVAGGIRVSEPAADLAVLLAIASSHGGRPLAHGTIVFGEVGLTGEIRPVPRAELRLAEAARLGFRRAIVPTLRRGQRMDALPGMEISWVSSVREALEFAM